jgi:hypothetical protein
MIVLFCLSLTLTLQYSINNNNYQGKGLTVLNGNDERIGMYHKRRLLSTSDGTINNGVNIVMALNNGN